MTFLRLSALAALVALPALAQAQTARLQVIHNAADPAAATVDVYINGDRRLDDFAFRTATPFIDVPAGVPLLVQIAPGTSTDASGALLSRVFVLPVGTTAQLIATGVATPSAFAANPDGRPIALDLLARTDAREASTTPGEVSFRVVHGATDAPTVDVLTGGARLVNDAAYTDITGYISVPPASYDLRVTTGAGDYVTSFNAPLGGAAGAALTVLASGFLDPAANQTGAAFGLLAVFADGTTLLLPAAPAQARLQVIHNAADPAAALVDVYVNGVLTLDDFAFRTATPFLSVPAEVPLVVAIAPRTSTSAGQALATRTYTLAEGSTTQLIANGVLAPAGFAANPDGRPTAFDLFVGGSAREFSDGPGEARVRVVHGATDAPGVDVFSLSNGFLLVDNAFYGDVTGYLPLPAGTYAISLATAVANTPVAAFSAELTEGATTILASGFLDPAANQTGEAFDLLVVRPDGTTRTLPVSSETAAPTAGRLSLGAPAPNPLAAAGRVSFSLDAPGAARLALYDALGRRVAVLADGNFAADVHEAALDARALAAGVYVLRLETATGAATRRLTVAR